uniref:Uncharacterized protein n=1 Tax=Ixodes ricinus TaxID=34613 RepID=A0A6B0UWI8_IXORI
MAQSYNFGTSEHEPRRDPAASSSDVRNVLRNFAKNLLIFFLKITRCKKSSPPPQNFFSFFEKEDKFFKKLCQGLKGHRVCIKTFFLESVSFMESISVFISCCHFGAWFWLDIFLSISILLFRVYLSIIHSCQLRAVQTSEVIGHCRYAGSVTFAL